MMLWVQYVGTGRYRPRNHRLEILEQSNSVVQQASGSLTANDNRDDIKNSFEFVISIIQMIESCVNKDLGKIYVFHSKEMRNTDLISASEITVTCTCNNAGHQINIQVTLLALESISFSVT